MSNPENEQSSYASEDEDDVDFCPEKEEATCETVSEEDSDDQSIEPKASIRKKAISKKDKRTAKPKEEEPEDEEVELNSCRRSLRLREGSENDREKYKLDKDELESDEEDKTRTNVLWANFLKDVKPTDEEKATPASNNSSASKAGKTHTAVVGLEDSPKQIKVIEMFEFADKESCVDKKVCTDSIKENKAAPPKVCKKILKRPATAFGRVGAGGSGIGSFLGQIGKKKKISVLEKSKLDWNSFKQDEGIEEELQTFNKGRDGFLERQDFLQRTDLRQFELEKNLRLTRKNLN